MAASLPSAKTVIQVIALADGKLKGHEYYLTKLQMIAICKTWLTKTQKRKSRR